jgi:hypothetical protein
MLWRIDNWSVGRHKSGAHLGLAFVEHIAQFGGIFLNGFDQVIGVIIRLCGGLANIS